MLMFLLEQHGLASDGLYNIYMKTSTRSKSSKDLSWFLLMGFNKDNEDETGFLALDKDPESKKFYAVTKDKKLALKFPSKNVNNVEGFGTPTQWLNFFKNEPELSSWKFHIVKMKNS